MSVTFSPALGPIDHWGVTCFSCPEAEARFDAYEGDDGALAFFLAVRDNGEVLPGCFGDDMACGDPSINAVEAEEGPAVNLSSVNARHLLEALGLDFVDGYGSLAPLDFLGRVLMALAVVPEDAGVPAANMANEDGTLMSNVIDCGRSPGYTQERLHQLHEVAQWCADHDRTVAWS